MVITDKNLEEFRTWMLERGRMDDTASLYIDNLRSCAESPGGLTRRLVAGKLAPNSLRTNLAALRAWALFSKDTALQQRLKDMRLPPARRVKSKPPLDLMTWKQVVRHLRTCKMKNDAVRQILLIMAIRGLRSGDVLRLKLSQVSHAVATGKLAFESKGRKMMEFDAVPIMAQLKALAGTTGWERVRDLVSPGSRPKVASKKIWRAARRTASKIGITNMNPHRYRHTFATNYLNQLKGDPNSIVKLQRYMGWESPNTAMRYVDQVSQDELDAIGAGLMSGLLD